MPNWIVWNNGWCAIKPNQTKLNQIKPNQTKSNQTKPNQTKLNQIKPNQTKSNQTKPNQTKSNQTKAFGLMENQIKILRLAFVLLFLNVTYVILFPYTSTSMYISNYDTRVDWFVWFVGFYDISTFVGYLTPNPFLCK